jgi:hypothetical protein
MNPEDKKIEALIAPLKAINLTGDEKRAHRLALLEHMESNPIKAAALSRVKWSLFSRKSFRVYSSAMAAFVLVFTSTVSYAAKTALPGEMLYPVKVNVNEEVISWFKSTPEDNINWELNRMEMRLQEAAQLKEQGQWNDDLKGIIQGEIVERKASLDSIVKAQPIEAQEDLNPTRDQGSNQSENIHPPRGENKPELEDETQIEQDFSSTETTTEVSNVNLDSRPGPSHSDSRPPLEEGQRPPRIEDRYEEELAEWLTDYEDDLFWELFEDESEYFEDDDWFEEYVEDNDDYFEDAEEILESITIYNETEKLEEIEEIEEELEELETELIEVFDSIEELEPAERLEVIELIEEVEMEILILEEILEETLEEDEVLEDFDPEILKELIDALEEEDDEDAEWIIKDFWIEEGEVNDEDIEWIIKDFEIEEEVELLEEDDEEYEG